jgi:hypothetical protein
MPESTAISRGEPTELATVRPSSGLALSFGEMTARVAQLDQFYRDVMQEGTDYGVIPGTAKPSLYQPGAQLLDQIFGLVPSFLVEASSLIDWERPIPFFHYVIRCRLVARRSGELVAEAIGSCNSHEDRYRWRNARKACPRCGIESIARSRAEYGGGYYCNKNQGGCGLSFKAGTPGAVDLDAQAAGRSANEDTASLENTILKMSQKRAHVAATLNATGASRIFTQDLEDLPQFRDALTVESQVVRAPAPPAAAGTAAFRDLPSPEPPRADPRTREELEREYRRLARLAESRGHRRSGEILERLEHLDEQTDTRLEAAILALERWEASLPPEPHDDDD